MGVVDLDGGQSRGVNQRGAITAVARQADEVLILLPPIDEGNLAGLGIAQRGRPFDHQVAAAAQLSLDHGGQLGKSRLHSSQSLPRGQKIR